MCKARIDVFVRLLARRVIDSNGCWIANSGSDNNGYRYIGVGGKSGAKVYAHRLAYERLVGPLQRGLVIDHLCGNRACFNPAHLEQVTQRENVMRSNNEIAKNASKTHCTRGHEYDDVNTYRSKYGKRQCRACRYIRLAALKADRMVTK